MNNETEIEQVIKEFKESGELSTFHIIKIANEVMLKIRNEIKPYSNDDNFDSNSIARAILKTALAALDT